MLGFGGFFRKCYKKLGGRVYNHGQCCLLSSSELARAMNLFGLGEEDAEAARRRTGGHGARIEGSVEKAGGDIALILNAVRDREGVRQSTITMARFFASPQAMCVRVYGARQNIRIDWDREREEIESAMCDGDRTEKLSLSPEGFRSAAGEGASLQDAAACTEAVKAWMHKLHAFAQNLKY